MTKIMVDELAFYYKGKPFCHMTSDNIQDLHQFAKGIGVKRCWFHNSRTHPHYDIPAGKRDLALANGAVFVPALKQARERIEKRNKMGQQKGLDFDEQTLIDTGGQ